MHKLFFQSILLTILLISNSFAARTAKVVMVRGKVSKLLPNSKAASQVKKGDMLPEDTSVLTESKSIVRLLQNFL